MLLWTVVYMAGRVLAACPTISHRRDAAAVILRDAQSRETQVWLVCPVFIVVLQEMIDDVSG